MAKELGHAEIHATDISPAALEVARANAARLQMQERVQFHQGNLLDGFEPESFDFVVSNPPYVGRSEEDQVQLEVRKFEPPQAVFAGETGIEIIAQLVPQAHDSIEARGMVGDGDQRNDRKAGGRRAGRLGGRIGREGFTADSPGSFSP